MSIRNAGSIIKETRKKKGYTQERLSEGICSMISLSRIENGKLGISPQTFKQLMERMGINCNFMPSFNSKKEFDSFQMINQLILYLDSWQFEKASALIQNIEDLNYAENKFYFQVCQFARAYIMLKVRSCELQTIHDMLMDAIHITIPEFTIDSFDKHLFSITDLKILILLAETMIYLNYTEESLLLLHKIEKYLNSTNITYNEKIYLESMNATILAYASFINGDIKSSLNIIENYKSICIKSQEFVFLIELTFISSLCQYSCNHKKESYHLFKICYFSSYLLKPVLSTLMKRYFIQNTDIEIEKEILEVTDFPFVFKSLRSNNKVPSGNGIRKITKNDSAYTIGCIIHDKRVEKEISQTSLCRGICSRSKLSKIENGTLIPKKTLIDSLFQRLGINADSLTIFMNTEDFEIFEIKNKIVIDIINENIENISKEINLLYEKAGKDIIIKQFCFTVNAMLEKNIEKKLSLFEEALSLTINNFNIININSYLLSYNELTILNNIAICYCKTDNILKGIQIFYKLIDYFDYHIIDIYEKSRTFCITLCNLSRYLYITKRYIELNALSIYLDNFITPIRILPLSIFMFPFCQSLFECKHYEKGLIMANITYSLSCLIGHNTSSEQIKKYIKEDFNTRLLF